MHVSDPSPAPAEHASEGSVRPVDIPFDSQCSPYALVDEKASQIVEAENQKLDDLIGRFTKGFDPAAFSAVITASIPKLIKDLFPGSYAHLLLILFETFEAVQTIQLGLETWFKRRYSGNPIFFPSETNITDETFFAAEIETLRKLLEPIREGKKSSIFWVNTRRSDPSRTCEQLEASVRVIESFKEDICAALSSGNENRTIYSTLPVSVERTAMYSMKQLRMDACRATLHWDNFNGSEIEFTSFYHFYKAHISTTEPARARASGWLPPKSPGTPRLSAREAGEGDLANWISHGIGDDIVDLLLKTALWLSLARGLAAVHLFCDVARLFVLHPPPMTISKEYRRFLLHLIRLRATTGGAQFSPSPIVPRDNKVFPGRNTDYFEDIWRTSHQLSAGLCDEISLFVKHNIPNFKLSKAPPVRRRSGHGDMHLITQAQIRGSFASNACSSDEESGGNNTTDEYDFLDFSSESSSIFRSKTV
ncbi:uncharacterized protein BDW70DRAFT_166680 [Aspergillus foveolatus]|uniref:uncharacterized protein n=1 Tax=Aspergillus foveolatus TaxID=210207 RepID=UPI003CCC98FF